MGDLKPTTIMAQTTRNLPPSLFAADGSELRLLPLHRTGGKPLYVSNDGRCFSYYRCVLRLVKPQADTSKTNRFNGRRKQKYLRMTRYGNILVHIAVAIAWIGPKPADGYVIDHLNGITTDNRMSNLQWVTPAENRRRARILRSRRQLAHRNNAPSQDPANMSSFDLLALFTANNLAGDVYEGD